MGSAELDKIRRSALVNAVGTVLEIGVGPGYSLAHYKNITKLYALEPSKEILAIAKRRADVLTFPVEFLNTGAESIPLPDYSVDTVVSTLTLCSVADPKKVLQEIARVLRPHGTFIFVEHGASHNPGMRLLQTAFTKVTKYFTGNCHYDREIERLIEEAGFRVKTIEYAHERFSPLIYDYQGVATHPSIRAS